MKRSIRIGDRVREVSSDDAYLANMGEVFEPDMTDLFKALIDPGMVVADVGANIGMTALLFSDLAKHVYAFEPGRSTYELLVANVTPAENVEAINVGMGAEPANQTLTFSKNNRSGGFVSSTMKFQNEAHSTENIRIETLDGFFFDRADRPDFIKLDVEGFEPAVLRGARTLLMNKRPTVVLELNHFCLNVMHRVALPDFFDQLRALFPVLLAVSEDNRRLANLHEPDAAYSVMHEHVTRFAFPNIVAGFEDGLHARMGAVAARANQGGQ